MSLNDELVERQELQERTERISGGDLWITKWRASLDEADKKTWDAWLNDPSKNASVMFRVIRSKGYPRAESTFRRWVMIQREQQRISS